MAQLPIGSDPFVLKSENKFQNFISNLTTQPVLNYHHQVLNFCLLTCIKLRVELITDTLYYILTNTTCVLLLHYKSWFLHAAYIGTTIMRSIKHILFHHTAVPPQIDDRDVNDETSRNLTRSERPIRHGVS